MSAIGSLGGLNFPQPPAQPLLGGDTANPEDGTPPVDPPEQAPRGGNDTENDNRRDRQQPTDRDSQTVIAATGQTAAQQRTRADDAREARDARDTVEPRRDIAEQRPVPAAPPRPELAPRDGGVEPTDTARREQFTEALAVVRATGADAAPPRTETPAVRPEPPASEAPGQSSLDRTV